MTLVLNKTEIERMRQTVAPASSDNSKEEKLKRRKALSEEKVQHWPNTLEALRKKKESFLKDKEERLEKERQQIDLEVCCILALETLVAPDNDHRRQNCVVFNV